MNIGKIKNKIWDCTITFEELDEFFGNTDVDQSEIIIRLLSQSLADKNGDAVDFLVYSAFKNGVTDSYTNILCELLSVREDWQYKHEDIATLIGEIKNPDSVPCLFQLAEDYKTSDTHSIPLKAMWSLRAIGNKEALKSLQKLGQSTDVKKAKIAMQQLEYLRQKEEST